MKSVLAIIGPTAIGKSYLALQLASAYNGEIVSADSRQVYRYMDIGTGKPTTEELAQVPHHLIDIVNPSEDFSLAQYQEMAYRAIKDIQERGKQPLLVGGTGLYVRAVVEGWQVPRVPPDPAFRQDLEKKAAEAGAETLFRTLTEVDPEAARTIDPRNVRRVIRALEVHRQTGVPFSRQQTKQAPPFRTVMVGLTADRTELYRRIDERVDEMMSRGLVTEVQRLINMDYGPDLPAMSGIGYRQIGLFLRGGLPLDEAVRQIKFETHRFARHQYAWFQLKDTGINWFDTQKQTQVEIRSKIAILLSL